MKCLRTVATFIFATILCPEFARAASVADFLDYSLVVSGQLLLPGRLFVPPEAASNPGLPRPFILFLHGGGESGANNLSQINGNIDSLLAEAKRRGAFLYAPQTPNNWSGVSLSDRVMTMVDRAVVERSVDADRLYITGLSNGGGGTWNMLSRYPERFAAGLPICGVSPAADFVPSRLVDQSILAAHARNDPVVSVTTSRNVISRILTAAGQPSLIFPALNDTTTVFDFSSPAIDLSYVELPTGGHGIWPFVYNTPQVYDWLFAHTTAVPEPATLAGLLMGACFLTGRRIRCRTRRHHAGIRFR
jgi:predicted peptidase